MKKSPLVAAAAFIGIVLTLIYTVRLIQEVVFQEERQPLPLADLTPRETCILAVFAVVDVWMGVHPAPLLDLIHGPVQLLIGGGL